MKQVIAAKLAGKSKSYVCKVANGTIDNERIKGLLEITDEQFLNFMLDNYFKNPLFADVCKAGIMHCKKAEARILAVSMYERHKKLISED